MIAFTIHEFAHAYTAVKFGDPTPRDMGRLTLNPQRHLDIFGTILFVLAGIGWAKPVLINPSHFKKPRLMSVIVSVAGPLSNLLLAFIGSMLLVMYLKYGWGSGLSNGLNDAINLFLGLFIQLNVLLLVFNLIPLPPLDGYRILSSVLPYRVMAKIRPYEQWAFFFILLIVFIPPLYNITLGPIFALQLPIINWLLNICASLFHAPVGLV
jgi:Zn-dependent protease